MNNERYQEIIDEVYEKYKSNTPEQHVVGSDSDLMRHSMIYKNKICHLSGYPIFERLSKEELIEKCKTDSEFSEKCGLKIVEETIFDIVERIKLAPENNLMEVRDNVTILGFYCDDDLHSFLDKHNVPRKFVTYYYKDEKIEVYEFMNNERYKQKLEN